MAKNASIIALKADALDPEDFDVFEADVARALAERRSRGPQKAPVKQQVTIRIDRDVLDHFRGTGPGWQSRLNDAARKAAGL